MKPPLPLHLIPELDRSFDFTAMYARKLVQNHPELAAVIEIRKRKGEP